MNRLTNNQRQLINKVSQSDSFLYELTEYITDKNQTYTQTLMERDGTGQLSTLYTYGNQRINSESYNNLTGLYTEITGTEITGTDLIIFLTKRTQFMLKC